MASWIEGVRAAQNLIEYVELCMRENSITMHKITLYPFRSDGGRSNGVTAFIENRQHTGLRRHVCVSVYEHWNADQIDIKFTEHVPLNMSDKHDDPSIQFGCDQVEEVVYAIQSFLLQYFNIPFPNEWYVPLKGIFTGFGSIDPNKMNYVDDKMTPILVDWLEPIEE